MFSLGFAKSQFGEAGLKNLARYCGILAVTGSPEGGVKAPHIKHTCIIVMYDSVAAQDKKCLGCLA